MVDSWEIEKGGREKEGGGERESGGGGGTRVWGWFNSYCWWLLGLAMWMIKILWVCYSTAHMYLDIRVRGTRIEHWLHPWALYCYSRVRVRVCMGEHSRSTCACASHATQAPCVTDDRLNSTRVFPCYAAHYGGSYGPSVHATTESLATATSKWSSMAAIMAYVKLQALFERMAVHKVLLCDVLAVCSSLKLRGLVCRLISHVLVSKFDSHCLQT